MEKIIRTRQMDPSGFMDDPADNQKLLSFFLSSSFFSFFFVLWLSSAVVVVYGKCKWLRVEASHFWLVVKVEVVSQKFRRAADVGADAILDVERH